MSIAVARKVTHYLHNLLLIHYTAIGGLKDWDQLFTVILYCSSISLTVYIIINKVHRSRSVEGNSRNYIFYVVRPKLLHKACHTGAFKLKYSLCPALADHQIDIFILHVYLFYVKLVPSFFLSVSVNKLYRLFYNCQVSKA